MTSRSTASSAAGQQAQSRRRRALRVATGGLVLGGLITGVAIFVDVMPAAVAAGAATAYLAKKTGRGLPDIAGIVEGVAGAAMAVWLSHAFRPRGGEDASRQAAWLVDQLQHIEQRERAATARERAVTARERAAADREQAAADREQAAADREHAAAARERRSPPEGSRNEPAAPPALQPADAAARQKD